RRTPSVRTVASGVRSRSTSTTVRSSRRRRRSRTRSRKAISASKGALVGASCSRGTTAQPAMARDTMRVSSHALFALGYSEPTSETPIVHITEHDTDSAMVTVAEEVPVALVFNGRPYAVVMATPLDLEDLGVGFSLTESIVERPDGIERVEI